MDLDAPFLRRCLELADMPGAAVEPNPRVGAVVVHGGRIIGEGYHKQFGGPHAEVNAVAAVVDTSLLPESTLYVSLEPCNHHGKTPPCTDLILRHGIRRVVVGSLDPHPEMGGKSITLLRNAGIEVIVAQDPTPFLELNRHFWINQGQGRPFVTLKWAESADGFIAALDAQGNKVRTAISGPQIARHVHALRHAHHAILVGAGTALVDDPALDTRLWPGRSPLPIVLDMDDQVPSTARLFQGKPRGLAISGKQNALEGHVKRILHRGDIGELLERLYREEHIGSILVEGGADILAQFIHSGKVDEIQRIIAPKLLVNGLAAPVIGAGFGLKEVLKVGEDSLELYQ
jgi:diaminohydroxyphosphoribosylaminopyrimidine deaminase/5-amino-6-(5-phosphoribosylamino)uracil reductase